MIQAGKIFDCTRQGFSTLVILRIKRGIVFFKDYGSTLIMDFPIKKFEGLIDRDILIPAEVTSIYYTQRTREFKKINRI